LAKIQKHTQDPVVAWLKDTHPEFRTTKRINLLRLREPKKFPYENKVRLHNEVTKDLIEVFSELNTYFYYLPVKNRMKVFQSREFTRFVTEQWLVTLDANDVQISEQKKSGEYNASQDLAYQNYLNLFNIGLEGLIKTMPEEFQNYISSQLKPMFKLMQSIAKFAGKDVPYIHFPNMFRAYTIQNP